MIGTSLVDSQPMTVSAKADEFTEQKGKAVASVRRYVVDDRRRRAAVGAGRAHAEMIRRDRVPIARTV